MVPCCISLVVVLEQAFVQSFGATNRSQVHLATADAEVAAPCWSAVLVTAAPAATAVAVGAKLRRCDGR
jgi:hypothetical protein